ncbi:type II toxin-antitoxin system RelE/ParE family toxin [Schaedlerella arabinosiphila]|jgi:addiction module toxin, RelE/StbE family|uniref:type II toxin-antitoxin system RelE/ParE family toxin n=1 Tax=Schaedlerella arabinosiphila TaxID=2044587 RepID=UPI0026BF3301
MYNLKYSGKMKKDIKLCQKRGYDFQLFEVILEKLMKPEPLDIKNKDHDLRGEYKGFRECHISPDCY